MKRVFDFLTKRLRAFVLGAVLLASSCGISSAAAQMAEDDAKYACQEAVAAFLLSYFEAKDAGATNDQILAQVTEPRLRRFARAESEGDVEGAKAALQELYADCVNDLIHPKTGV